MWEVSVTNINGEQVNSVQGTYKYHKPKLYLTKLDLIILEEDGDSVKMNLEYFDFECAINNNDMPMQKETDKPAEATIDRLYGEWYSESSASGLQYKDVVDFYDDSSFLYTNYIGESVTGWYTGTYTLSDGIVSFTVQDGSQNAVELPQMRFSVYGKELRLTIGDISAYNYVDGSYTPSNKSKENISSKEIVFRDIKWGSSLEEVKKHEITSDMVEGTDWEYDEGYNTLYIINLDVAGFSDVTAAYIFANDKFVFGNYVFSEDHTNPTDYYNDYNDLKEKFTSLYGNPEVDKEDWKDDHYKDEPSEWGMAVITGQLECTSMWKDESGTEILLSLTGDNYKASLGAGYISSDYSPDSISDAYSDTNGL